MREGQWVASALIPSAALVILGATAIALASGANPPEVAGQDGASSPALQLRAALDGRPELAKLLQNMQIAVVSGTKLSQREQRMLVAVVASLNHCLY